METEHRVQRAIIVAAGTGQRMQPLTFETPKPLIKVNGVRMIDTLVDGLHQNGIHEIYVVVGHLKEQFAKWAQDKREIRLIENPYYDRCNNISSLYVAREHLEDCIIMDGDQLVFQPSVLQAEFSRSGYNAVWCEGETTEWLMEVRDGVVKRCSRTGGAGGWQLYSISRWTKEDGRKLKKLLEMEFEGGHTQLYWDDVVMFCHFDSFQLGIFEMKDGDVIEIDNLRELASMDSSYQIYVDRRDGGFNK